MFKRVTFTGVDERTSIGELQEISKKYPFAEFGVLVSENNTRSGEKNRYPGVDYLHELTEANIPIAAHVCGRLARDVAKTGNMDDVFEFLGTVAGNYLRFGRIQLNIMGAKELLAANIFSPTPIILQVSDRRSYLFWKHIAMNKGSVIPLFDKSGGEGKSSIENNDYAFCVKRGSIGFAGGLNEKNFDYYAGFLYGKYCGSAAKPSIWLDMESGVRTDDWFDTEKVRAVCEKAKDIAGKM